MAQQKPFKYVGRYIKHIREAHRLTLQEVAYQLRMKSSQNLSMVENGTTLLQGRYQARFCEIFGLDKEKFFKKLDDAYRYRDVQLAKGILKGTRIDKKRKAEVLSPEEQEKLNSELAAIELEEALNDGDDDVYR